MVKQSRTIESSIHEHERYNAASIKRSANQSKHSMKHMKIYLMLWYQDRHKHKFNIPKKFLPKWLWFIGAKYLLENVTDFVFYMSRMS